MKIEVWSDIVCPFCYIGKRNLETALAQFPRKSEVEVIWRSFELDPNAAKDNGKMTIYEILAKKYKSNIEWAKQMTSDLAERARSSGLELNFEKQIPTNSFDAHRLLHLARQNGLQDQAQEKLFAAYFTEGKNISDHQTLKEIALSIGLDEKQIDETLSGSQFSNEVRTEEETAAQLGLTGVPAFVVNRKYLVSGAQPAESFLQVMTEAIDERD